MYMLQLLIKFAAASQQRLAHRLTPCQYTCSRLGTHASDQLKPLAAHRPLRHSGWHASAATAETKGASFRFQVCLVQSVHAAQLLEQN